MSEISSVSLSTAAFEIRAAADLDIQGIQDLLRPYVEQKKLLRRTKAELHSLISNGFVAESEGKIVGFAAVEIYSRKLGEIQCLAVAKEFQGRGIGTDLVRRCVDKARDRGILEVMAISSSEQFLRNIGFDYSLPDQKRALFFQLRSREEFSQDSECEE